MFVTERLQLNKITRTIHREILAAGMLSTSNIQLVDFESFIPALQIIESDMSGDPVRRFEVNDGDKIYFDVNEIIQWGDRHGYRFVNKSDIDPIWIEYHRLHHVMGKIIKRIVDIEKEYEIQERHTIIPTPSYIKNVESPPVSQKSVGEHAPSIKATELAKKCAAKELAETKKALERERRARRRDARIIERLKDFMTSRGLEKMMNSDIPKKHKPKDDGLIRAVCFPVQNDELLQIRPLSGFDEVVPKEKLLTHAKPVRISSTSGIYFLLNEEEEIVYIGQATNLIQRIGTHCREKAGMFSKVIAVAVPKHRLGEVEANYIRAYKPKLNKTLLPCLTDWVSIERDFSAGNKAMRQISEEYGRSPDAILKRAKRDGWVRMKRPAQQRLTD